MFLKGLKVLISLGVVSMASAQKKITILNNIEFDSEILDSLWDQLYQVLIKEPRNMLDRQLLELFNYAFHEIQVIVKGNPQFNQAFDDFENQMFATDAFHAGFHELYLSGKKIPHHKKYNISQMLNENQFLELTKMAKDTLNTQYAPQKHFIYHYGMRNAWNYWVCIKDQLSVLFEQRIIENNPSLTDPALTEKFLTEQNMKNFMGWRGASGSDDIEWVGLGLINAYKFTNNKVFLDMDYQWNGARGVKQLYTEVKQYLDTKRGGIYWDLNRTLKSAISSSLWVLLSSQMYLITKEQEYLEQAISMYTWLTEQSGLIDEDGFIYDGMGAHEDRQTANNKIVWSYNSGTFLGGLKELYTITKDDRYFKIGQKVANKSLEIFVINGEITENKTLDTDGAQFKGIYVKYLAEFLVEFNRCADESQKEWINYAKSIIIQNAKHIVSSRMTENGLLSSYWGRDEPLQFNSIGQVSGMDLLYAAHLVSTYI